MDEAERTARRRYFTIGLVRLAGALSLAFGAAVAVGNSGRFPLALGYAALVVGVLLMLVVPQWLVARWRTPPEG